MMTIGRLVLAALLTLSPIAATADVTGSVTSPRASSITPPSEDFRRAADLFEQGRRDEAVFWYYRARVRGRVHVEARPELASRGDRALLLGMRDAVGKSIESWALRDTPALTATIEKILAWHDGNDDPFTPKAQFPAAHAKVRSWLAQHLIETQLGGDKDRVARMRDGLLPAAR